MSKHGVFLQKTTVHLDNACSAAYVLVHMNVLCEWADIRGFQKMGVQQTICQVCDARIGRQEQPQKLFPL